MDLTFTFDAQRSGGKTTTVVFETLYAGTRKSRSMPTSRKARQFTFRRSTRQRRTRQQETTPEAETTTVIDAVTYTNLIPGRNTPEGNPHGTRPPERAGDQRNSRSPRRRPSRQKSGRNCGHDVHSLTHPPWRAQEIVAFESVEYKGIEVAVHADLADENQTIHYPSMHTTAAAGDGGKTLALGNAAVLNDTVTYTGLTPGKTYVLKGEVMDKETGKTTGFTAETTFTAQTADGSAVVAFSVNTDGLEKHELVVFEDLYDTNGTLLLSHHDLSDTDQTVTVPEKPVIPPVVTGDNSTPMPMIAGLLVCLAVAAVILTAVIRRRKRNQ